MVMPCTAAGAYLESWSRRYLSQLRLLATGYSSFPADLRTEMKRSPFLLGVKRMSPHPSDNDRKAAHATEDDDSRTEFVLARASDLAIVDDSYLAKLFSDAFIGAPEVSLWPRLSACICTHPSRAGNVIGGILHPLGREEFKFLRKGRASCNGPNSRCHRCCDQTPQAYFGAVGPVSFGPTIGLQI